MKRIRFYVQEYKKIEDGEHADGTPFYRIVLDRAYPTTRENFWKLAHGDDKHVSLEYGAYYYRNGI